MQARITNRWHVLALIAAVVVDGCGGQDDGSGNDPAQTGAPMGGTSMGAAATGGSGSGAPMGGGTKVPVAGVGTSGAPVAGVGAAGIAPGGASAGVGLGGTGAGTGTSGADAAGTGAGGTPPLPPPECEDVGAAPACLACTRQGLVEGATESATCKYLGIPYARPPVGELRFAAPQPADPWTGVLPALDFGAACMQESDLSGTTVKSEDCLFLNVWTPAQAPAEPLPVMVFIHGGGYRGGATNTYLGLGLSESGPVVVVSMNYRVGALGFFAHSELDSERIDAPSGSDAIRDQQLALQWVRDNIRSFHGDPNDVTIFGESAGSSSVCIHLVSPGSRHLGNRFIMESGVCTGGVQNGIGAKPQADMYALTEQMAADLCSGEADVIACLRALPAEQLMLWALPTGGAVSEWGPVIEGPGGVLPMSPDELVASGDFHKGEVIIGTNKNEYGLFALLRGSASSVPQMRTLVEDQFGGAVDEIMAIYAPSDTVDANQAYVTLMTDVMFRCGSRRLARALSAQGSNVFLYSFEQGGAIHADELTYVFGFGYNLFGILPAVQALVDTVQGYWTSFAANGSPNGSGRPEWPLYDEAGDLHLTLVNPPTPGSGLQAQACDFWDAYVASQ